MKRNVLMIFCLLMLATSVLAQNTQRLPQCEEELKTARYLLGKERDARKGDANYIEKLESELNEKNRKIDSLEYQADSILQLKEELESVKQKMGKELQSIQEKLNDFEQQQETNSEITETILSFKNIFPFYVTDIEYENRKKNGKLINGYCNGASLSKIERLAIKIHYNSLLDEAMPVELIIKVYKSNNKLWTDGYIDSYTARILPRIEGREGIITLNEWKKKGTSIFPPGKLKKDGKYRIEIWYKDVCLGQRYFTIENQD